MKNINYVAIIGDIKDSKKTNNRYKVQEIEFEMHPIRLRFGLGVGEITTQVIRENALGSDGPAYHYAREQFK